MNFNNSNKMWNNPYPNVAALAKKWRAEKQGKIAVTQILPPVETPLDKVKKMKEALK